jgi:hypothetical protein
MLEPGDRSVFTELLRPPSGFRLDRVITTTYTLDLVALLTLPLSFTLLAGDGLNEAGRVDPIALLEALRRYADRLYVFCDSSHIAVPKRGQILFGYLEKSVMEAAAPKGGAFHPKVTVVRYTLDPTDPVWTSEEKPADDSIRYRVMSGTRNLTFDRSWDTMLAIDGELVTDRSRAFSRNHPLSRFIKSLPGLAVRSLPESKVAAIDQVADELLRVDFFPPEGFGTERDDLAFWPIGLDAAEVWPFAVRKGDRGIDRFLVVSPFVDKTCIDWLQDECEIYAVVSRPEELDLLPAAAFDGISSKYILADAAEIEPAEEAPSTANESASETNRDRVEDGVLVEPSEAQLRGLHAKMFLADSGWNVRLWTGSANATRAAFVQNVEFLVELRGKKSLFGIDTLLGSAESESGTDRQVRFRNLLTPYVPIEEPKKEDSIKRKLEQLVEDARRGFRDAKLIARVTEVARGLARIYEVAIETGEAGQNLAKDVECSIRPISLAPDRALPVTSLSGQIAKFDSLAFESLTGFCAVTVTARVGSQNLECDFVLTVPLIGAPLDRENRLLLAMLSNRERLLRYLLMLLEGTDEMLRKLQGNGSGGKWGESASFGLLDLPLLEPLLRALAEDPARLAPVERLVRDLEETEEGRKLLPPEFVSLWASIRPLMLETHGQPKTESDAPS